MACGKRTNYKSLVGYTITRLGIRTDGLIVIYGKRPRAKAEKPLLTVYGASLYDKDGNWFDGDSELPRVMID